MLRLALTFYGRDSEFDRLLGGVRDTLLRGANVQTRRAVVQSLADALAELAERPPPAAAGPAPGQAVVSLLDRLEAAVPEDLAELRTLRGRFDETREPAALPALLDRLAALLNRTASAAADTTTADPFCVLLERLQSRAALGAELRALRTRAATVRAAQERLALVDTAVELLAAAMRSGRASGHEAAIGRVLRQLLDWLALPASVAERCERLRARLDGALADDEITAVLKEIAGVVGEVRGNLERELARAEDLLRELGGRVAAIDRQLVEAAGVHEESVVEGEILRAAMNAEIDAWRGRLTGAMDLEAMRAWLEERFASIGRTLDGFVSRQRERHRAAEAKARSLAAELEALGRRTAELQSALAAERELALRDALTGVANRRALDLRIAAEIRRRGDRGGRLCLAILDLDHFKHVNDAYGHKAGDKVLVSVAELCRARLRETDLIARYGGEEFVLLFAGADLEGARAAAEALRTEIAHCRFHHRGTPVPVTVSIGIAELRDDEEPSAALERADRALYAAKAAGRDRVADERDLDR